MKLLPVIEMVNVFKAFDGTIALQGLSLKVEKGIFGLIGPNGSGKSTTIKILLNIMKPDDGEARILGLDCQSETMQVHSVTGVLLENPFFPPTITAIDYLSFVGAIKGLSGQNASAEAISLLKWLGLEPFAKTEIGGYSAGMKQRLGLAQALIGRPDLVLLDEPTSNLDPLARMRILAEIRRLSETLGISFLISSHILPELENICDQIGILHNGVLIECGDVSTLTDIHPSRLFKVIVSDNALFLREMQNLDFVEEAYQSRGAVFIKVKDAKRLYNEIVQTVQKNSLGLRLFQPVQSSLDAVYEASIDEKE